jgi:epoxyqueuosine reductase QueG
MRLDSLEVKARTQQLFTFYKDQLRQYGRKGLFGVAKFPEVYDTLMPVQQERLRSICGDHFNRLLEEGSIISIAIAYDEDIISTINVQSGQGLDIEKWNVYAREYDVINSILNAISKRISKEIDGIAIPATWVSGVREKYKYVRDAFGETISHRAVAEIAGLGWRGKNGLVINETYSCAIRFASIIVPFILSYGQRNKMSCSDCTACEKACSFIRNKSILSDYRDYCRRYIDYLTSKGLKHDVCGKCIKACYFESIYSKQFHL